jgi:hypothetical protein
VRSNSLPREKWVSRIVGAWQGLLPCFIATGSHLEAAKEELRRGEWMAMVKNDLPFSQSTANKLMKIAKCDHLRNSDHGPSLPACWRTLYELTTLTAEQFERGIKTGVINPKMQRKSVKALRSSGESASINTETRASPFAILKRHFAEQERELAALKAKLASVQDGNLFDLKRDTPKDIADVVASTVSDSKASSIADAIKIAIKNKYQTAAREKAVHS